MSPELTPEQLKLEGVYNRIRSEAIFLLSSWKSRHEGHADHELFRFSLQNMAEASAEALEIIDPTFFDDA